MAKEVIWAKSAREEKDRVLKFWIKNNGTNLYSIKLENLINQIVRAISEYPKIGKKTSVLSIRVITLKTYQIFYREENQIQIIVFWDSRQNPKKLKKNLLDK